MLHRRHLVYFKAVCVYAGTAVPVETTQKQTLNQTGLDKDWTSPESEFGWVLWTTGSVLVSALSLHSQSRPHPQLHPHPWSRLDPTRGPLLSETSADVLALMLSPREKTIQWSTTKTGILEVIFTESIQSGKAVDCSTYLSPDQLCHSHKQAPSHCSTFKGEQLKGFPPNCTITIYKHKQRYSK